MRRIYLIFLIALSASLLCTATALAGPVLPEQTVLTQPDGTTIDVAPFGDEWDNGYETLDGFTAGARRGQRRLVICNRRRRRRVAAVGAHAGP